MWVYIGTCPRLRIKCFDLCWWHFYCDNKWIAHEIIAFVRSELHPPSPLLSLSTYPTYTEILCLTRTVSYPLSELLESRVRSCRLNVCWSLASSRLYSQYGPKTLQAPCQGHFGLSSQRPVLSAFTFLPIRAFQPGADRHRSEKLNPQKTTADQQLSQAGSIRNNLKRLLKISGGNESCPGWRFW